MTLFSWISLIARQSLPGILDFGNPSILTFYVWLIGSNWSSNLASEASLHLIDTSKLTPQTFENVSFPSSYRICEDTISSFWSNSHECGVHTGLTSTLFSDSTLRYWITKHNHSLCPASGRFVYFAFSHEDPSVVVMDLIWFYYSGSKPEEPNYWKDTVIDVLKYSSIYLRII